eukprot:TRINITY_DN23483_c0_g1_i1.p1 TRINITY_DN23483_c0_g1~~TRINITY_DN23483_c0_g1_i1.p1  ORF type:complete len:325 (+),score=-20.77 TRINITY_DN23483_c0_g1_i1:145-1119(+)
MVDVSSTKIVFGAVALVGVCAYFLFYVLLDARLSGRIASWQAEPILKQLEAELRSSLTVNVTRQRRGSRNPELCVAALSCRRYDLLERTLSRAVGHLDNVEPDIDYELVVFDNGQLNGSALRFRYQFVDKYQLDKWSVSEVNRGVAYGLNVLFHGLCRAPAILSLEDDWEFHLGAGPIVRTALNVLKHDSDLVGVYIKVPPLEATLLATDFRMLPDGAQYKNVVTPPGSSKYHFANGGTLLNRTHLVTLGPQNEGFSDQNDGEFEYKKRCADRNLTMGILVKEGFAGLDPKTNGWFAMSHIGGGRHVIRDTRKRKAPMYGEDVP